MAGMSTDRPAKTMLIALAEQSSLGIGRHMHGAHQRGRARNEHPRDRAAGGQSTRASGQWGSRGRVGDRRSDERVERTEHTPRRRCEHALRRGLGRQAGSGDGGNGGSANRPSRCMNEARDGPSGRKGDQTRQAGRRRADANAAATRARLRGSMLVRLPGARLGGGVGGVVDEHRGPISGGVLRPWKTGSRIAHS